jgi:hypothetical protein
MMQRTIVKITPSLNDGVIFMVTAALQKKIDKSARFASTLTNLLLLILIDGEAGDLLFTILLKLRL